MNSPNSTMLRDREFPEEALTKPIEGVPSKLLAFAMRIDPLTALVEQRLAAGPDPDAVLATLADLAQVRALAGTVLP
jgi:hypothetical protein